MTDEPPQVPPSGSKPRLFEQRWFEMYWRRLPEKWRYWIHWAFLIAIVLYLCISMFGLSSRAYIELAGIPKKP